MMNKQKTSKAGLWKVATFLPLLALLLMAFGKTGENASLEVIGPLEITQVNPIESSDFSIEIRKDGNYIDNKLVSLEEIVKGAKAWQKTNEEILLSIEEPIPYGRIDEVREALLNAKVYFVNQSSLNSNEIIYPAGDVTELAKFTKGKWNDWLGNQLKDFSEGKPNSWKYKIQYSFIIDKKGNVRDGHIIKGSEYPEINAAFEQILTQIPDWKPAKKGGKEVNVLYSSVLSKVTFKPKVDKK